MGNIQIGQSKLYMRRAYGTQGRARYIEVDECTLPILTFPGGHWLVTARVPKSGASIMMRRTRPDIAQYLAAVQPIRNTLEQWFLNTDQIKVSVSDPEALLSLCTAALDEYAECDALRGKDKELLYTSTMSMTPLDIYYARKITQGGRISYSPIYLTFKDAEDLLQCGVYLVSCNLHPYELSVMSLVPDFSTVRECLRVAWSSIVDQMVVAIAPRPGIDGYYVVPCVADVVDEGLKLLIKYCFIRAAYGKDAVLVASKENRGEEYSI